MRRKNKYPQQVIVIREKSGNLRCLAASGVLVGLPKLKPGAVAAICVLPAESWLKDSLPEAK
jgi:hypothetical protein